MISYAPVTLRALSSIHLKTPKNVGSRWKGVHHSTLIDVLRREAEQRKFGFSDFHAGLSRSGADLTASFELPRLIYRHFDPSVGLVASNSGRRAIRFWIGGLSKGEPNSLRGVPIVGRSFVGPRYTQTFSAENCASNLFDELIPALDRLDETCRILQGVHISDENTFRVESIIMQAGARKIIPPSRVVRVLDAWSTLTSSQKNLWNLARCFSYVVRQSSPTIRQMDQNHRFLSLIMEQK